MSDDKGYDKANEKEMGALHGIVASVLADALEGRPLTDKDGNVVMEDGKIVRLPPDPRHVANAIKFLKDNGINGIPTKGGKLEEVKKGVLRRLPFLEPHEREAAGQ